MPQLFVVVTKNDYKLKAYARTENNARDSTHILKIVEILTIFYINTDMINVHAPNCHQTLAGFGIYLK